MSEHKTGIIVKVTEEHIVVLCPDKSFHNLPRAADDIPSLGTEIDLSAYMASIGDEGAGQTRRQEVRPTAGKRRYFPKHWIGLAALLLISFSVYLFWPASPQNDAAYVVQLQINPHLKMHVNEDLFVTALEAVNEDAREMIVQLDWRNRFLKDVTVDIIYFAAKHGHLSEQHERTIHTWIEPADPGASGNEAHRGREEGKAPDEERAGEADNWPAIEDQLAQQMESFVKEGLATNRVRAEVFVNRPVDEPTAAESDRSGEQPLQEDKRTGQSGNDHAPGNEHTPGNDRGRSESPGNRPESPANERPGAQPQTPPGQSTDRPGNQPADRGADRGDGRSGQGTDRSSDRSQQGDRPTPPERPARPVAPDPPQQPDNAGPPQSPGPPEQENQGQNRQDEGQQSSGSEGSQGQQGQQGNQPSPSQGSQDEQGADRNPRNQGGNQENRGNQAR